MTRNNQLIIGVVGFVVAAAAFYMLALKPKREDAARLATQIQAAQTDLDAARAELATYVAAKAGYKRAYSSVVRLGKAVPADDDVRSLVVQLDAAAKAAKVDFRTINVGGGGAAPAPGTPGAAAAAALPPGATVGPAGFPTMPFSFTFTGDFFNLSEFFRRLERFVDVRNSKLDVTGRLLTLDSITLEPHQGGFPRIQASVGATSFLVSPLQGLTAGATAAGPTTAAPATPGATPAGGTPAAPPTTTATGVTR